MIATNMELSVRFCNETKVRDVVLRVLREVKNFNVHHISVKSCSLIYRKLNIAITIRHLDCPSAYPITKKASPRE